MTPVIPPIIIVEDWAKRLLERLYDYFRMGGNTDQGVVFMTVFVSITIIGLYIMVVNIIGRFIDGK